MADRDPIAPHDGREDAAPLFGGEATIPAAGDHAASAQPTPTGATSDDERPQPGSPGILPTGPSQPGSPADRQEGGDVAASRHTAALRADAVAAEPTGPGAGDERRLTSDPDPAPGPAPGPVVPESTAAGSGGLRQPSNPEPAPGVAAPAGEDIPPRRLHPAGIAIGAVRRFRGFAIPLVVILLTRDPREAGTLGLVLLATLAAMGWQAVEWASTRWSVEGNRLRLTSGVLGRRERLVPLERVQAVDLSDTPLERVLGVTGVRVETAAGGAEGGITLEAVGRGEAEALRARLLAFRDARRGAVGDGALPGSGAAGGASVAIGARPSIAGEALPSFALAGGPPLYRMGWRDVLLAGATSGRIGPAVALLGFGFSLLDDLADLPIADRLMGWMPFAGDRGVATIAFAVAAAALLAWLLAIGGAALTWAGFELRVEGDRVLLAHGLLDRRRRSVPLARMQALSVRESLLRRPFGLAEVRFESAGRGADAADSGVLLPLVRASEAPALLAAIAPAIAPPAALPEFSRPPARARSRFIVAAIRPVVVLVLLGVAAAAVVPGVAWWWGLALLVGVPLAVVHGELAWRDSGWALDGDRLLLRNGGLERRLTAAPRRRLQRRGTVQTPLARRAALATFRADVPSGGDGGRLRAPHLDAADAARLVTLLRG